MFIHFEHENWKPILMKPYKYKASCKPKKKSLFKKKKNRVWGKLRKTMEKNNVLDENSNSKNLKSNSIFAMFE